MSPGGRWRRSLWVAVVLLVLGAGVIAHLELRGLADADRPETALKPQAASTEQVAKGAYLARAGNCAACHTARGGAPYAGGKAIATPFGSVYAGNITPDPATGIGRWTADDFWNALHEGRARNGRYLVPAFPYPEYTHVTRDDSDAIYAYLQSLAPVPQANRAHELRFPYTSQTALAVWRTLYFRPAAWQPKSGASAEWNRGAYLVQGLGHCAACHAPRNALGATRGALELTGGLMPEQRWYAPSLASPQESGVQDWPTQETVRFLRDGKSERGVALGPMAEVVFHGTQHLSDADLRAMALYLQSLPRRETSAPRQDVVLAAGTLEAGARLYRAHCAECHGERGEGRGPYAALAGHRSVTMADPANLVKLIIHGGFAPTTPGNPRPWGMPPMGHALDDTEIAAIASYVRQAWGNQAPGVLPLDVLQLR